MDITLFCLLALIAEIIGTISGFGSSILFIPIASIFFEFKTVLGVTAIFHVFSNVSKIALFRQGIKMDLIKYLGIPAVIFVTLGAWLTTFVETDRIELMMSLIVTLLAIYLLINKNKTLKQTQMNLILGGCSSGFLAGFIGTGGAIRGMILTAFQLPKDIFISTSAIIDLGVDSSRAIVYTYNGYFSTKEIYLIPYLVLISLIGSYLGKLILKKTSESYFRMMVISLIIGTSIYQIVNFFLK